MGKGFRCVAMAASCGLAAPAVAQTVVNGDFETGTLSGWTVVNTPNGLGAPGSVVPIDVDGPGPLGVSLAARFSVGLATYEPNVFGGVEMTQSVAFTGGYTYAIELDWLAQREIAVGNAEGGVFELLVGGTVVAAAAAGETSELEPHPGHLYAAFTTSASGPVTIGVRITRPYLVGGLLYQYVDNVRAYCYANCDASTQAPVLNVQDFTCFLQRYAAGKSYANCDESTQVPVLNVQDFTCFLQRYAQGCP